MDEPLTILHVDDDCKFTELTATFLEAETDVSEVVPRQRGEAALEYLDAADAVDCVVSDYALLDMDGLAFLDAVRSRDPGLPFIFFTGKSIEAVADDALAGGATDYLQKQPGTDQYSLLANRVRNAVERYRDRRKLERSERYRRELYRITSATGLDVAEKVDRLLELGCERLGLENGHVVRIDRQADRHEVRIAAGSEFVRGDTVTDLGETFCRRTIFADGVLTVSDAAAEGWGDDPAHETWNIAAYIGGKIEVDGELYGTVCFVDREPRARAFNEAERTFVELVSRWISHMVDRQEYERDLRSYKHVVDLIPDAIFVLDDREFVLVNDAMVSLTGYDRDELIGADASLVFAAEDPALESLARTKSTPDREPHYLETPIRTVDGETVACEVSGVAVPDVVDGAQADVTGVVRRVAGGTGGE